MATDRGRYNQSFRKVISPPRQLQAAGAAEELFSRGSLLYRELCCPSPSLTFLFGRAASTRRPLHLLLVSRRAFTQRIHQNLSNLRSLPGISFPLFFVLSFRLSIWFVFLFFHRLLLVGGVETRAQDELISRYRFAASKRSRGSFYSSEAVEEKDTAAIKR